MPDETAAHRMSLDDVLKEYGYTREQLDAMPDPIEVPCSYLCGECGHTDAGPIGELVPRMTDHWRSHWPTK